MSRGVHVLATDSVLLAGVVEDGALTDLMAERLDDEVRPGDVYLGRVDRRFRDTGSAYVDLGFARPAFLQDAGEGPADTMIVQVARSAREDKSVEVTRDIALPGSLLVYRPFGAGIAVSRKLDPEMATRWRPEPPGGWIVRRAAARATDHDIVAETSRLAERWRLIVDAATNVGAPRSLYSAPDVAERLILDTEDVGEIRVDDRERQNAMRVWLKSAALGLADLVEGDPLDLSEEIEALLSSEVSLSKGASIVIEPTRALTVIDVNAGGAADFFQVNREAARAIARQLRLRNIGGIVVVDFITMKRRDSRNALVEAFRGALDDDPAHIRMSRGMSGLGLVELARERRGLGLAEVVGG